MNEESRDGPLVSVIIPAHNREATIGETLASVTKGTYRNIQIIVIDDGSTDSTVDVVEAAMEQDARIRLLRREWGGVSAASSGKLADARGDYVAYLDSDDLWHPTKLEKQVALAEADPGLAFIYTFVRMIDPIGRVVHDVPEQRFPRHALCRGLYESLIGANSSALVRHSVLTEVGNCTQALQARQDLMLQLNIFARHPVGFVPEYLTAYRHSPGSLSGDADAMLGSWRAVAARAAELMPSTARKVRRWADARQYSEMAETFVRSGRYGIAAKLSLAALSRDPSRMMLYLLYRLERIATRAQRRSQQRTEGPAFESCDPVARVRAKDPLSGGARRLLEALDRRRIRMLTTLDRRAAEAAADD